MGFLYAIFSLDRRKRMTSVNPWKFVKNMAGALGMSAVMAGCAMTPINDSSGSKGNQIVAGCVWPNHVGMLTYATADGSLYQVQTLGDRFATVRGSVQGGDIIANAVYNAASNVLLSVNSRFGLQFGMITNLSVSQPSPSVNELFSDRYAFKKAAQLALYAVYGDRTTMPTAICSPSVEINGYRRASPRLMFP
jgi:hypothetical protein